MEITGSYRPVMSSSLRLAVTHGSRVRADAGAGAPAVPPAGGSTVRAVAEVAVPCGPVQVRSAAPTASTWPNHAFLRVVPAVKLP